MTKKIVRINPSVKIYNILRHLSYQPWYAFAEYIDNSLQSFLDHEELLKKIHPNYKLKISITFGDECVIIEDNAAGIIAESENQIETQFENKNYVPKSLIDKYNFKKKSQSGIDLRRDERWSLAFKLAEEKEDSGFNRFGMGMKTASLWLCDNWRVKTKGVGDKVIRSVVWDAENVTTNNREELISTEQLSGDINNSFTVIELRDFTNNMPSHHSTITRLIEYVEAIYKNYLKRDDIEIIIKTSSGSKKLTCKEIEILEAPFYKDMSGPKLKWKIDIDEDLGNGQRMWGFVAISKKMSNRKSGFSVFFNNRIIEGAGDKKWIPSFMGGESSNSTERGSIFGELHVEGFELSHTKDRLVGSEDFNVTFDWSVKDKITDPIFPLLDQAKHFKRTETVIEKKKKSERSSKKAQETVNKKSHDSNKIDQGKHVITGAEINKLVEINQEVNGDEFTFKISINADEKSSSLYTWRQDGSIIYLNINRSFPIFSTNKKIDEETIIPIIMSMCIAEIQYTQSGTTAISSYRYNFENNLTTFLS